MLSCQIVIKIMMILVFKHVLKIVVKGDNDVLSENIRFRKCCPNNSSLLKFIGSTITEEKYVCINKEMPEYYSDLNPLFVNNNATLESIFLIDCKNINIIPTNNNNVELQRSSNFCYDRLRFVTINATIINYTSKSRYIICKITKKFSDTGISHVRKCCEKQQLFDTKFHSCRQVDEIMNETMFLKRLKVTDSYKIETDTNLYCENGKFFLDIKENMYFLNILNGSILSVTGKHNKKSHQLNKGEWCVDYDYANLELIARVCTHQCSDYGILCHQKCCQMEQHYETSNNCTDRNICVSNMNNGDYYISSFLKNISKNDMRSNVLFSSSLFTHYYFTTHLKCPADRYLLEEISEERLKIIGSQNYCIEVLDRRSCGNGLSLIAMVCFPVLTEEYIQEDDFSISFVTNGLSIVCLALTLMVYCGLSELRNLHGRILICHLSMMLLARCCLVRTQAGGITNGYVCTMLGYGMYFGFMAAFVWLSVMCVDMWWTLGNIRTPKRMRKYGEECRRFLWYSIFAWSVVTALTGTMFLLDQYPVVDFLDANIGYDSCWFGSNKWSFHTFFVIPMGLITCINFVLWVLTARYCSRIKSEVRQLQATGNNVGDQIKPFKIDSTRYMLTVKLWIVMQAGWLAELFSTLLVEPKWLWKITDFFNELQGMFIFFILIFKPKLYFLIKKKLGFRDRDNQRNGRTWSMRTSFMFLSRTNGSDERNNDLTTP